MNMLLAVDQDDQFFILICLQYPTEFCQIAEFQWHPEIQYPEISRMILLRSKAELFLQLQEGFRASEARAFG